MSERSIYLSLHGALVAGQRALPAGKRPGFRPLRHYSWASQQDDKSSRFEAIRRLETWG
jgi:hypothetical protein